MKNSYTEGYFFAIESTIMHMFAKIPIEKRRILISLLAARLDEQESVERGAIKSVPKTALAFPSREVSKVPFDR